MCLEYNILPLNLGLPRSAGSEWFTMLLRNYRLFQEDDESTRSIPICPRNNTFWTKFWGGHGFTEIQLNIYSMRIPDLGVVEKKIVHERFQRL